MHLPKCSSSQKPEPREVFVLPPCLEVDFDSQDYGSFFGCCPASGLRKLALVDFDSQHHF
jgi:hypothetical protein